MANTIERVRGIADLEPLAYALLMTRVGLGVIHVGHALMMSGLWGFSTWWADGILIAQGAGGALLLAGIHVRQAAIALLPFLVGTALLHLAAGTGAGISFGVYFIVTLVGQGLLAGWTAPVAPAVFKRTIQHGP